MSDTPAKSEQTSSLTAAELAGLKTALLARRAEATSSQRQQLRELNDSDSGGHLADLEEMSSSQDVDSMVEILDIQDATLARIDEALELIEAGTYGVCEDCDGAIPFARLEALPFATVCVECQRQRELHPDD